MRKFVYICIYIYIYSAGWLDRLRVRLLARSLPGLLVCWLGLLACLLLFAHLPACLLAGWPGCLAYLLARLLAGMVACSLACLGCSLVGLLYLPRVSHYDSAIHICGCEYFRSAERVAHHATINPSPVPLQTASSPRTNPKSVYKSKLEDFRDL